MSSNRTFARSKLTLEDFPDEIANLKSLKQLWIGLKGIHNGKERYMERLKKLLPDCETTIH